VVDFGDVRRYRISSATHLFHYLKERMGKMGRRALESGLADSVIPLPTANAIAVRTTEVKAEALVQLLGAERYREPGYVEPLPVEPLSTGSWALDKIMADSAWAAGYDGSGILVVVMDTGIDTSHPYLIDKWSGLWYDPVELNPRPVESDFPHGTIVSGALVADSTGVAPGAKLAVVRMFGKYLTSSEITTHLGFQRILEWKIDSGYDIRVYNGSWKSGGPDGYLGYWNDIYLLRLAGIVPVFALGNTPGVNFSPGNYPLVVGVGATYDNDTIAHFSSEGPAPDRPPWNDPSYWPYPDWNLLKPDLVAPGVGVLSTVPGGGFGEWTGTSLAAPLVAGAVAILLQRDPTLTYKEIYAALRAGADTFPWGSPYPNNTYGWGRLNVWKSLNSLSPPSLLPKVISWEIADGRFDGVDTLVVRIFNYAPASGDALFTLIPEDARVSVPDSERTATLPAGDTLVLRWGVEAVGMEDGEYAPFTLRIAFSDTLRQGLLVPFGVAPKEYVDIDTGALKISLSRTGKWFRMLYGGVSLLFAASFAFGIDTNYVADAWMTSDGSDADFAPTDTFVPIPFVAQGWYIEQSDSGHPSPRGLTFRTAGYTFPYDATLYLSFTVRNTTPSSLSGYLGFFADPDVGWAPTDTGYVLPEYRCLLVGSVDSSFVGYVGFQVMGQAANLSFISNSLWYDSLNDAVKYRFMSGDLSFAADTVADWSLALSVGPITLSSGDSATMYLKVFYSPTPTCPLIESVRERVEALPVSIRRGRIVAPDGARIYDLSGRLVGMGDVVVPAGVYFVVLAGRVRRVVVPR